jgi:hypothetical protein
MKPPGDGWCGGIPHFCERGGDVTRPEFFSKAASVGAACALGGSIPPLSTAQEPDDTAYVQRAMDEAAKGDGIVRLPPIRLHVRGTVLVPPGVREISRLHIDQR